MLQLPENSSRANGLSAAPDRQMFTWTAARCGGTTRPVALSGDRSRGAGIGFAIVKQLVELSGGRVGVESAGGLTYFWFWLPG